MKLGAKVKSLIGQRALTEEELAARADLERIREQARQEAAKLAVPRR